MRQFQRLKLVNQRWRCLINTLFIVCDPHCAWQTASTAWVVVQFGVPADVPSCLQQATYGKQSTDVHQYASCRWSVCT